MAHLPQQLQLSPQPLAHLAYLTTPHQSHVTAPLVPALGDGFGYTAQSVLTVRPWQPTPLPPPHDTRHSSTNDATWECHYHSLLLAYICSDQRPAVSTIRVPAFY